MDYVPGAIDAELYHLRTKTRELEIELDTLNAQNVRLTNENSKLSNELNLRTKESKTASSINAELRMMLFKAENERDELNNSLQSLKGKYNKLYDKYAAKDRTFKAVNESFRVGNRMSSVGIAEHRSKFQRPESIVPKIPSQCDSTTLELNRSLEESYDKIEELEFELESIEILEHENEYLRNELNQFKESTDSPASFTKFPKSSTLITEQHQQQQQQFNQRSSVQSNRFSSSSRSSTSSGGDYRFSTATTVKEEDLYQGHYKLSSDNNNNENIYEPIGEVNKIIPGDNNDDSIINNESLSPSDRKPPIKEKPSFLRGARSSVGGDVKVLNSSDTQNMLNLVDELQQFKFKNSSQGPKQNYEN